MIEPASPARVRFDDDFLRKLETLAVVAKRAQGSGARADRRARRVGGGIDFADHRTYAPGDDVRSLDWNLLARLDRAFVRLREEDEDLTLSLIVDASASMACGAAPKLELAVRIAAALAYIALGGLDRVSVTVVGAGVRAATPPLRGKGNAARVLDLLGGVSGEGQTDLAAAARQVLAARGTARRGRTILVSDLFDPAGPLPALTRLRGARQDVVLIQVTDAGDATPGGDDGDITAIDSETGVGRALTISAASRRAQQESYRAWLRGIAGACRQRAVPCFQIEVSTTFEDAVLRILRAGGIVA